MPETVSIALNARSGTPLIRHQRPGPHRRQHHLHLHQGRPRRHGHHRRQHHLHLHQGRPHRHGHHRRQHRDLQVRRRRPPHQRRPRVSEDNLRVGSSTAPWSGTTPRATSHSSPTTPLERRRTSTQTGSAPSAPAPTAQEPSPPPAPGNPMAGPAPPDRTTPTLPRWAGWANTRTPPDSPTCAPANTTPLPGSSPAPTRPRPRATPRPTPTAQPTLCGTATSRAWTWTTGTGTTSGRASPRQPNPSRMADSSPGSTAACGLSLRLRTHPSQQRQPTPARQPLLPTTTAAPAKGPAARMSQDLPQPPRKFPPAPRILKGRLPR